MKNKKILFCIDTLNKGGAERVVSILANELSKDNNVYVLTIVNHDKEYLLSNKIKYDSLEKKSFSNRIIKKAILPIRFIHCVNALRKLLIKERFDIIISFLPFASFISSIAKTKNDKLIISERNDPVIEYKPFLYNYLMKKYYPKADGFVFQTNDAKNYFNGIIDYKKIKSSIILNPVNNVFVHKKNCNKKNNIIVNIGRLTEQKNQELLIKSFNEIKDDYPDINLNIYGDGYLKDYLENIIKGYKLENRVFLKGIVNDIADEIVNSRMFVLSSNYEGLPNSLIEAMTLGLPCISTDCPCGGPRFLIKNNKNGLLVEMNDFKQLADRMRYLLDNDRQSKLLGNNAKNIIKLVSTDVIISKWKDFISDVIAR